MATTIRVGTRGSALALAQTEAIATRLGAAVGAEIVIVPVTTHGDTNRASLATIGGTGIFAGALRDSLLAGECDLVVHSLKDLPTAAHPGLRIGTIPQRADARDALCARDGLTLADLPAGAVVGTGSPRRAAQIRVSRPDLVVRDIRGNVDTRLSLVTDGEVDAVVLSAAGLHRLGRSDVITELLELHDWPTAPGQGALALEVRDEKHPRALAEGLAAVNHAATELAAEAERAVLAGLEAGCSAPVGASAFIDGDLVFVTATVYSLDGSRRLTSSHAVTSDSRLPADRASAAREAAAAVVAELLAGGAAELTASR